MAQDAAPETFHSQEAKSRLPTKPRIQWCENAWHILEDTMRYAKRFADITILSSVAILVFIIVYVSFDYQARIGGFTDFLFYYVLPVCNSCGW